MAVDIMPAVAIVRPVTIDPNEAGARINIAAVDPNVFFAE